MNYGKVVSKGFLGWNRDGIALKSALWAVLVFLVVGIVQFAGGALLFGSMETYLKFIFNSASANELLKQLVSPGFLAPFVAWAAIAVALGVLMFFIRYIFAGKILRQALLQNQPKVPSFGTGKGIRLALLQIALFLVALFSWYNKKWLLLLLAVVITFVIFLAGAVANNMVLLAIGLLLFLLSLLAYLIVVIYNSFRLCLAEAIFVEKEQGIFVSLRESWALSEKKALRVGLANFLVGIILAVVLLVFTVPSAIIQFLAARSAASAGLLLPAFILQLAAGAIAVGLTLLVQGFALPEIYRQIQKESPQGGPF